MYNLVFDPSRKAHVLVALGCCETPKFYTIHSCNRYLEAMGEEMVNNKKSQFRAYHVVDSNQLFSETNLKFSFDQAIEILIKKEILAFSEK